MFDSNSPLTKRAIAELTKREIYQKLFNYALWRAQSDADAKDLLADAIECVGDPDRRPWDPTKCSFFQHMRRVMDVLAIERARRGHGRFEVVSSSLASDEQTTDPAPAADEALDEARKVARLRRLGDRLLSKLEGKDTLAHRVYVAACEGAETAREQAEKAGCSVAEVYEAHRRLVYHGAQILDQEREAEAARMKALREEAKKKEKK